eukprot:Sspe_Gene.63323::Locus_36175_Transcript_1_1_Confidence_1.000_Length_1486::g.63323::m.63323
MVRFCFRARRNGESNLLRRCFALLWHASRTARQRTSLWQEGGVGLLRMALELAAEQLSVESTLSRNVLGLVHNWAEVPDVARALASDPILPLLGNLCTMLADSEAKCMDSSCRFFVAATIYHTAATTVLDGRLERLEGIYNSTSCFLESLVMKRGFSTVFLLALRASGALSFLACFAPVRDEVIRMMSQMNNVLQTFDPSSLAAEIPGKGPCFLSLQYFAPLIHIHSQTPSLLTPAIWGLTALSKMQLPAKQLQQTPEVLSALLDVASVYRTERVGVLALNAITNILSCRRDAARQLSHHKVSLTWHTAFSLAREEECDRQQLPSGVLRVLSVASTVWEALPEECSSCPTCDTPHLPSPSSP